MATSSFQSFEERLRILSKSVLTLCLVLVACHPDAPVAPKQFAVFGDSVAPLVGAKNDDIVPGKYLVKLRSHGGNPKHEAEVIARGIRNAKVRHVLYAVNGFSITVPNDEALNALRRNPNVERVEYVRRLPIATDTQTLSGNGTWGLDRVDQATGTTGSTFMTLTGPASISIFLIPGLTQHPVSLGGASVWVTT